MNPSTTSRVRCPILLPLVVSLGCGPIDAGPDEDPTDASTSVEESTGDGTGTSPPPAETTTPSESTGPVADGTATDGSETTGETGPDGPSLPPECDGDLLASDVLSPEEVYIAGTLSEGACYLDVLAHWTTPNDAVAGFGCYFSKERAMIRPTDGRLLYTNTFEGLLREFHCDTCPIDAGTSYPDAPLANDVVLPTPGCVPRESTSLDHLVAPDGTYVYRCNVFSTVWYDAAGEVVHDSPDALLHLGHDGLALTSTSVVSLATGAVTPIEGLPLGSPLAIRADPEDGFRVVMVPEVPQLWHVSATGATTSLGIYPPVPDGYAAGEINNALDGCGVLYQPGGGSSEVFEDVILRRELGGTTEVVYTEASGPLVLLHISDLVTGP